MLKRSLKLLLVGLLGILVFAGFSQTGVANDRKTDQILRVYNPNTGEHLYTKDWNEKESLVKVGWRDEGVAWGISTEYQNTVYETGGIKRLYNPNAGVHHYARDFKEIPYLIGLGWRDEGYLCSSTASEGRLPVYRLYNPNSKLGLHFFTVDANEKDSLVKAGWKDEGVHFYASSIN